MLQVVNQWQTDKTMTAILTNIKNPSIKLSIIPGPVIKVISAPIVRLTMMAPLSKIIASLFIIPMTYVLIKRTANSLKLKTVSGNIPLNLNPQPLLLSPKLKLLSLSLRLYKVPTSSLPSAETAPISPTQEPWNKKILIRLLNPQIWRIPPLRYATSNIFTKIPMLTISKILKAKMDKILTPIWRIKKKPKIQKIIIPSLIPT